MSLSEWYPDIDDIRQAVKNSTEYNTQKMSLHNWRTLRTIADKILRDANKPFNDYTRLLRQNTIYQAALMELARLGNGNSFGNSEGNVIAQAAMKKAEGV